MDIPASVRRLLWEYDLQSLDFSDGLPNVVCERVMSRGGWDEMRWLIEAVGVERLRSHLEERGTRVLPPREVAFWCLVCSVPEDLAQEWVAAAREREAEWRG